MTRLRAALLLFSLGIANLLVSCISEQRNTSFYGVFLGKEVDLSSSTTPSIIVDDKKVDCPKEKEDDDIRI